MESDDMQSLLLDKNGLEKLKTDCKGFIGKADRDNSELYLPLWMHMMDTAGMMIYLLQTRMSDNLLDLLDSAMKDSAMKKGESCKMSVEQIAVLAALLHDIGKASAAFQGRISAEISTPGLVLIQIPDPKRAENAKGDLRNHAAIGRYILRFNRFNRGFASICGAHHGITQPESSDAEVKKFLNSLNNMRDLYGGGKKAKEEWQLIWKEIIGDCLKLTGISEETSLPGLNEAFWSILSGLLVEADWLASNIDLFPLISTSSKGDMAAYPERWEKAWKKIDFPKIWHSPNRVMDRQTFQSTFGFRPNSLQENLIEIVSKIQKPGLLVIEAQMGLGKTEAALAAAEIVSGSAKTGGIFYGLPTRATADGLFGRFSSWAESESDGQKSIFKLAHSTAFLNEEYNRLPKGRTLLTDDEMTDSNLFVHDWMQQPKTGILSDFVIGTVDQGLMMALDHKHFMLKHLGMASKTVIIDEVHAYDAYMNVFFDGMLQWLGEYHVPVILLSATLPASRKLRMIRSYQMGCKSGSADETTPEQTRKDESWKQVKGYPLITWTDGDQTYSRAVDGDWNSVTVKIYKENVLNLSEMFERIGNVMHSIQEYGGCAGIIVNTVRHSQEIAEYLNSEFPDLRVILLHSRFTDSQRAMIETEIQKLAGKKSTPEQRNKLVIVGTQVIEQSLDLDFDVMITELAPMDLLLQRMGRLHRHWQRQDRPSFFLQPSCHVLVPDLEEIRRQAHPVYQPWYLFRTEENLPATITLPGDIPLLVEKVYDIDLKPIAEQEKKDAFRSEKNEKAKEGKAETGVLVPKKIKKNPSVDGLMKSTAVTSETQAVNFVREGTQAIDVLLIQKNDNGDLSIPDPDDLQRQLRLEAHSAPEFKMALAILKQRVSIPVYRELNEDEAWLVSHQTEFSEWKKSPLLKSRTFVVADQNGRFVLNKNTYEYSDLYGLKIVNLNESLDKI